MINQRVQKFGAWHVASAQSSVTGRFVSWAKMGAIVDDDPLAESGQHVWFNFGDTRDQAIDAIRQELGI